MGKLEDESPQPYEHFLQNLNMMVVVLERGSSSSSFVPSTWPNRTQSFGAVYKVPEIAIMDMVIKILGDAKPFRQLTLR